ncbi:DUF5666 domain-containing protein [Phenylobacterium sp.]|uniref:DUF5666 domain-containing protein n=1 Tax=Phenylobacterium sp. TaxID=1871053 RepID=UPI001A421FDB|nr:DUF5666 domain-containing protein [Phenylobacterium sp.]MBL8770619.1 hypothetical protein [Phenylobacterium sp.]
MYKILAPLAAVAMLLVAVPAAAHDEKPVTGQVTAVTAKSINIKMSDGQVVTLEVDSNTRVMKDGKRLTPKDVKVGQSVKALGFGDSLKDLVAIDVTITAPGKGG